MYLLNSYDTRTAVTSRALVISISVFCKHCWININAAVLARTCERRDPPDKIEQRESLFLGQLRRARVRVSGIRRTRSSGWVD